MSRYEYIIAEELIADQTISFNSLVMALMNRVDGKGYQMLRNAFPEITQEYWDRHYGVNGYIRGESPRADKVYQDRDTDELAMAQWRASNGKSKHRA